MTESIPFDAEALGMMLEYASFREWDELAISIRECIQDLHVRVEEKYLLRNHLKALGRRADDKISINSLKQMAELFAKFQTIPFGNQQLNDTVCSCLNTIYMQMVAAPLRKLQVRFPDKSEIDVRLIAKYLKFVSHFFVQPGPDRHSQTEECFEQVGGLYRWIETNKIDVSRKLSPSQISAIHTEVQIILDTLFTELQFRAFIKRSIRRLGRLLPTPRMQHLAQQSAAATTVPSVVTPAIARQVHAAAEATPASAGRAQQPAPSTGKSPARVLNIQRTAVAPAQVASATKSRPRRALSYMSEDPLTAALQETAQYAGRKRKAAPTHAGSSRVPIPEEYPESETDTDAGSVQRVAEKSITAPEAVRRQSYSRGRGKRYRSLLQPQSQAEELEFSPVVLKQAPAATTAEPDEEDLSTSRIQEGGRQISKGIQSAQQRMPSPIRSEEDEKPKQRRRYFTKEEEQWLREGVQKFGVGSWAIIRDAYPFEGRTSVNLKDKWRNMAKSL